MENRIEANATNVAIEIEEEVTWEQLINRADVI